MIQASILSEGRLFVNGTASKLIRSGPSLIGAVRFSHYNSESFHPSVARPKVTLTEIKKLWKNKTPIAVVTAHDFISGRMAEKAQVDMVLVGDSLSMVALGHENTNEIELDDMIYHSRAVKRGVTSAFLVADLPFGSYEESPIHAFQSAKKMIKKAAVDGVKMEGGKELAPTVKHLTTFGIPVLGHIGLTPQRQAALGGFKVQGKTAESAMSIYEDALALQAAGAFGLVLECVPERIARLITDKLSIPTIGIGAGRGTSGQVLVQLDMLGGFDGFAPKFLKRYSNYLEENVRAISEYKKEVVEGAFPAAEHIYVVKDEELNKFKEALSQRS